MGLVTFSRQPLTRARPTTNRKEVKGQLATLGAEAGTAIGDVLQRALNDIRSGRPTGPAWVLRSPTEPAPAAATLSARRAARGGRHGLILAVAVGRADATMPFVDSAGTHQLPVPPDLHQLTTLAAASGGRALAAPSVPALETALGDSCEAPASRAGSAT